MLETNQNDKMLQQQVKNAVECKVRLGTISIFQVKEALMIKGLNEAAAEQANREIVSTYERTHPRY